MARHADVRWNLPEGQRSAADGSLAHSWEAIQTAILMDIRDRLNVLRCAEFQQLPQVLRGIRRNTAKPPRRLAAQHHRRALQHRRARRATA